jgi:hypothetical protein
MFTKMSQLPAEHLTLREFGSTSISLLPNSFMRPGEACPT